MHSTKIKSAIVLAFAALMLVLGVAACGDDQPRNESDTDISEPKNTGPVRADAAEGVTPDKIIILRNVDDHPNIVILCYGGIAIRTISTTHSAYGNQPDRRVPEWDRLCPGYSSERPVYPTGDDGTAVATTIVESGG